MQLVKTELSIIDSENQVNKNKKSIRSDKIGNIPSVELVDFFFFTNRKLETFLYFKMKQVSDAIHLLWNHNYEF